MTPGEKLKQARLAAGLSQRQLCGERITRNMLSQIENGTARPSVPTLQYLADRLKLPVSWFLGEDTVVSPNLSCMETLRRQYREKNWQAALQTLTEFQKSDPLFGDEEKLLAALCRLGAAEQAVREQKLPYAGELLERAEKDIAACPYLRTELERRRLLLAAQAGEMTPGRAAALLPDQDGELLLRAEAALEADSPEQAEHFLACAENRETETWYRLAGMVRFRQKRWAQAAEYLEKSGSRDYAVLEVCYRELGDFQKAYEYACRQR